MKSRITTVALLALVAISLSACVGRVKSGNETFADTEAAPKQTQSQSTAAETRKTR